MYAALLGHADRVTLVSWQRLAQMAAITYRGSDEVVGIPTQLAFGYSPRRPGAAAVEGSTFGMAGANGSAAYADISTGVTVAVIRIRFTVGDFTAAAVIGRLVAAAAAGGRGFAILHISDSTPPQLNGHYVRNEAEQARELSDLLSIFDTAGVDATFVMTFVAALNPTQ
jgi:hypothetical protein